MPNRFTYKFAGYVVIDNDHPSGIPTTISHHLTEFEAAAEASAQQRQQEQADLDLSHQHRGYEVLNRPNATFWDRRE